MLTIHMHNDGRVQLIDKDSKPYQMRYVELEALIDSFRGQAMQSSLLPEGTLQYWRGHNYEIVAIYRKPHTRDMFFYEQEFTMPVPGTVFVFRVHSYTQNKMTLAESAIFAVTDKWIKSNTQLYGYPYGNVFEDHTICWGDLEFNDVTLQQLAGAPDIFLGSPYNDDLEGLYQDSAENPQNLFSFWEDVATQPSLSFPNDRLVPACLYEELPSYLTTIFY